MNDSIKKQVDDLAKGAEDAVQKELEKKFVVVTLGALILGVQVSMADKECRAEIMRLKKTMGRMPGAKVTEFPQELDDSYQALLKFNTEIKKASAEFDKILETKI